MKKYFAFPIFLLCLSGFTKSLSFKSPEETGFISPHPLFVNCLCSNDWIDGQVKNTAEVELRERTANGPILKNASVKVNGQELVFAGDEQIYRGNIGKIEQWQRIPIQIQTQDGRKVDGYVAVVFLLRISEPKPFVRIPSSYVLPMRWEYSEGSMHTVELLILRDNVELKSLEVAGNYTTLNFKRLGLPITKGDTIRLLVLPFWTRNSELNGHITKSSKAQFITRASLTVQF